MLNKRSNIKVMIISILIIILVAIGVFFIANNRIDFKSADSDDDSRLSVKDFMPTKPMILVYSGGFENGGDICIINKIVDNKFHMQKICTGTSGAAVYELKDDSLVCIYDHGEGASLEKDYMDEEPNMNFIILKEPIRIGTNWTGYKWNDTDEITSEITGIDIEIETPAGKFKTIEVTRKYDDFLHKQYYAKEIGLVKDDFEAFGRELLKIEYDMDKAYSGNFFKIVMDYNKSKNNGK